MEASRESLGLNRRLGESPHKSDVEVDRQPVPNGQEFDSSDVLEEYIRDSFEFYNNSNVGPTRPFLGDVPAKTAETVLYGNWEQDNNLDGLSRCSTPGTVIHHRLDEDDNASVSSSPRPPSPSQSVSPRGSKDQGAQAVKVGGSVARDWSMFKSNLVDYGSDEPTPRIPGCSAGHPYKKTWMMTDTMMMAYNAMRGPTNEPGSDPLRNWMAVKAQESVNETMEQAGQASITSANGKIASLGQQSHQSPKGKGKLVLVDNANGEPGRLRIRGRTPQSSPHKQTPATTGLSSDERREMEDYAMMLKEANMASYEYAPPEMNRNATYEVPRPKYIHVSPKFDTFNFEDYLPAAGSVPDAFFYQPYDPNRDFAKEYDISDDEGDPESGRISPCTFRLLAEGCSKLDPKANQVFMAEDARRMRPPTPLEEERDPRLVIDRLALSFEIQRDVNDGGWITPRYSVESEPSIIYSPPGVTLKHRMRNWWFGLFDRMDPIAARRFRKYQFREAGDPVTPLETTSERSVHSDSTDGAEFGMPYTTSIIEQALNSSESRRVAGIAPENARLIISQRWQTVSRWKNHDDQVTLENESIRRAIERARIELRELRLAVDHLLQKRAAEQMAMRRKKNKRVLRRVSAHLHELRFEIQSKFEALRHTQDQNEAMRNELAALELEIRRECDRADMAGPEEVRKAVSERFGAKMKALGLAG
ncbi:hypothetical protein C8035_v001189 [Colletotrichum spinosum]|uniref:Uncharacterized protein n=1 Tax=Colletotrichum spinosum TaxID=1347390 RepID=A0A4R8QQ04_9PEZI|nr:hypothetical protein C8035_v001189 [Colletotrichum spinosum]